MERKNRDYAGDGGNTPFANFEVCEFVGLCSTEEGIVVRMLDKMRRLATLVKPGAAPSVLDESIQDTLQDLINYCVILEAWLRERTERSVLATFHEDPAVGEISESAQAALEMIAAFPKGLPRHDPGGPSDSGAPF